MTGFRSARGAALPAVLLFLTFAAGAAQAQTAAASPFSISGDGQEVTDSRSGLVWRRCAEGLKWDGKTCAGKLAKFKLAGAKEAAKAAGGGWRLPTKDELVGLVVKGKKKPLIDDAAFPGTPKTLFWSTRPGFDDNLNAWLVNFSNGKVDGNSGAGKFALRLVHAKQ